MCHEKHHIGIYCTAQLCNKLCLRFVISTPLRSQDTSSAASLPPSTPPRQQILDALMSQALALQSRLCKCKALLVPEHHPIHCARALRLRLPPDPGSLSHFAGHLMFLRDWKTFLMGGQTHSIGYPSAGERHERHAPPSSRGHGTAPPV